MPLRGVTEQETIQQSVAGRDHIRWPTTSENAILTSLPLKGTCPVRFQLYFQLEQLISLVQGNDWSPYRELLQAPNAVP